MDITRCIKHLRPSVAFKVVENDIDRVSIEGGGTVPTLQECVDVWPTVEAEIQAEQIDAQVEDLDKLIARGLVAVVKALLNKDVISVGDLPPELVQAYQDRQALKAV